MLARVGGRESEAAGVGVSAVHDAVVVIEGLVDGDLHSEGGVDGVHVRLEVEDFGFVVS